MVKEFSAGGIVFKKVKGPKTKDQRLVWLVAQHSHHKGWVFPKGLIGDNDPDEKSEETAVREVAEETGIKAKIINKQPVKASFFYSWHGEKRFKTVDYYLMEYQSGQIQDHDWEMSQVEWLNENEVEKRLTFKSDKISFRQALASVAAPIA